MPRRLSRILRGALGCQPNCPVGAEERELLAGDDSWVEGAHRSCGVRPRLKRRCPGRGGRAASSALLSRSASERRIVRRRNSGR